MTAELKAAVECAKDRAHQSCDVSGKPFMATFIRAKLADAYRALAYRAYRTHYSAICPKEHQEALQAALEFVEAENKEKSDD